MKVAFLTCFLSKPTPFLVESLENCLPTIENAGWEHVYFQEVGCPYISNARSTLIKKALTANADVMVFLDYDISFPPESMLKLLETQGDVVAGTYRMKHPYERYMVQLKHGTIREDGCIQAEKVPAGFLKITKTAVALFAKAYPELLYGGPLDFNIDMFNHGAIDNVWYGEDFAFAKRWNDKCGPIWLIPDIEISHHKGNIVFRGNLHKHLLRNKQEMESRSENPLVSVIITNYNYAAYVDDAIQSVLSQTHKNVELIVVDDGSTDNSQEVLQRYTSGATIIYQKNKGVSAARNAGAQRATGEWLVFLDADDKLRPAYIERCLGGVEDSYIIGTGQQNFGLSNDISIPLKEPTFNNFCGINRIHCASMHRTDVWKTIGGFDETICFGYEDWDYWLRAQLAGFSITTISDVLFMYRKHGPSLIDRAIEKHAEYRAYILEKNKIPHLYGAT